MDEDDIVAAYRAAAVPELDIRGDVQKACLKEGFGLLVKRWKMRWKKPIERQPCWVQWT